jgi:D-beta-D-heptose 7-phosphate kinase/D-beta-D-heptose 1-phosphate adenosyltransferase
MNVFVNGTFDVLHLGHIALLNYAKNLGDTLFVGIDSDRRVGEKKGPSRPINAVYERQQMLLNLKAVDEVMIFDSDQELEMLVKQIRPGIMVVGSDWEGRSIIGSEFAKQLVYYSRIDGYSSTQKIQDIIDRR